MITLDEVVTWVVAHDRIIGAVAVALGAGLVRGYSGFGPALLYVPLMSALYDLRAAVTTMVLIDVVAGLWLTINSWRQANLHEVKAVVVAALFGIPIGLLILIYTDTFYLRWAIAVFVVGVVCILAADRRYSEPPTWSMKAIAGFTAGVFGTAFQMDGPPVVIFWLGGKNTSAVVRANVVLFLEFSGVVIAAAYAAKGWISLETLKMAFSLLIPFSLGTFLGHARFAGTSETAYRRVAIGLILVAAIVSLPVFDAWVK